MKASSITITLTITIPVILVAALAAGCASRPAVPEVRFANAPPVTAVNDRRDVPERPWAYFFSRQLYHFDGSFYRLITRGLEVPRPRRARGVNALDEVPDSTWFTNRIGVRALTLDEVRRGPATVGSPEPHRPWTIHSTKVGGVTVGFILSDARGERWLLKFDRAGFPELETANQIIAGKLLWAAGYNITEDHVVYFRPEDLVVAKDAVVKDRAGDRGRLDRAGLERSLAQIVHERDGRIRGMASRMLEGKPLGGHIPEGVRPDDPNDRIPHELRRDLRGLYVFSSWLDHNDVKEDNTLDVWVTDPADPRRHYVQHYLVDYGTSLGAAALFRADLSQSYRYRLDWPDIFATLGTLGLRPRIWEGRTAPELRGVGMFEVARYRPDEWKPNTPSYLPFRTRDDLDGLWGARILVRFTREQIRAIVETARLSDPRAVDHITETLIARQRIAAYHWLSRGSALDAFTPSPGGRALCFDDLLLTYQLSRAGAVTRYTIAAYDRAGRRLGAPGELRPSPDGRTCAPLSLAPDGDGYTIVRLDTRRPGGTHTVYVHLARDPASGAPRVIGIWRP